MREGFEFKLSGDTTLGKTARMTHFTALPAAGDEVRGNDPSGVLAGLWVDCHSYWGFL
jgi:hypothetical protein